MFTRIATTARSRLSASLPRTTTALGTTFSRRPETLLRPLRQQRYAGNYQRFPGQNRGGPEWTRFGPFARANYIVRNNPKTVMVVVGAGGTFYVVNLEQVPITGRRRFNLLSPETEKEMAGDYNDILRQFQGKVLPEKHPYTQLVAKVVERLLPSSGLAGDEWRVFVIDDPKQMNAFVVPGGKVFVFSGILPIAQDEAGLAAVLGHEIAHNVAHHVAEKISGSLIWTALTFGGSLVLGIDQSITNSITQLALALPNSRTMEEEADHIGLLLMAESCYDPSAAVGLWKRMHDAEKGAPPQFLSTHPSSLGRMERIKGWLPQAEERYNNSECGSIARHTEDFRRKIGQSSTPQVAIGPPRSFEKDDDFF